MILLIYYHPLERNAATLLESVDAFEKYYQDELISINMVYGFPRKLDLNLFNTIIFHYSLFGSDPFVIDQRLKQSITKLDSKIRRIAFFQDEQQFWSQRKDFILYAKVSTVFTILDENYHFIYLDLDPVVRVQTYLTGYVSDELFEHSVNRLELKLRPIDIGYRARKLPIWYGKGGAEKTSIMKFADLAKLYSPSLRIDVSCDEADRIYGDDWWSFITSCKFMLGVESGTSIVDLDGTIRRQVDHYLTINPHSSGEEILEKVLSPYEDNINYRAISPRIFECAAMYTCMILFEGDYQGLLEPDIHFIPLKKDFSNYNMVLEKMNNPAYVTKITTAAYNDLIRSKRYSFERLLSSFDTVAMDRKREKNTAMIRDSVEKSIQIDFWLRWLFTNLRKRNFPGRKIIKNLYYSLVYMKDIK